MKKHVAAFAAVLCCLGLPTYAYAQGGAGTLGTLTGIVTDKSGARLPGVAVRVVNEDTGVAGSALTNESGDFSFLLSPGANYKISAEIAGFQKSEITKLKVSAADTVRADLVLQVGDISVVQRVEANRNPLLQGVTQDVGNLLDEVQIQGLPLVGNDPLALITTLPGYRANPLGHEFDTVGGLPMTMINTVRDGLSVTDELYPGGVGSGTILNPDMISEIRLILAPVDAEAGRGNGQVQITTKSGTNKFQWNINYNLRQNALNALGPSTTRVKQPFGVTFQYVVSAGGPIIKNRTFYFVNWDQQIRYSRYGNQPGQNGSGGYQAVPALTDPARNGLFRWFDGWASQPSATSVAVTPAQGGAANGTTNVWSVDPNDPTVVPRYWPAGFATNSTLQPYTGALKCISVFGTIKFDGTPFDPAKDCGTYIPRKWDDTGIQTVDHWVPDYGNPQPVQGVVPGGLDYYARQAAGMSPLYSWERLATQSDGTLIQVQRPPDRTGYMQRLISFMPRVNTYISSSAFGGQVAGGGGTIGSDGLNRAAHEWVHGIDGYDNRNTFRGGTFGFGTSLDQAQVSHKIINIKIDHIVDSKTRVSFGTSFQTDQNSRSNFQSRWPDGINGFSARVPRVMTINAITTLSSNMVNEARFGLNINRSTQLPPWENPNAGDAEFARSFLQKGWVDPNCDGTTGRTASDLCQTYDGITPIYYTPGSPGIAGFGYMSFADNVLPSSANQGFGNSNTSYNQCSGQGVSQLGVSYNCETAGRLFNFADTFSWNYKAHSIRGGGEFRLTRTREDSSHTLVSAAAGASTGSATPLATINQSNDLPGFGFTPGPNGVPVAIPAGTFQPGGFIARLADTAGEMLYLLSGSVSGVTQTFWANGIENFQDSTWETWSTGDGRKTRHTFQNEFALFLKDDWKIGKRLTLNLGVRYESYGNLYTNGFNTGVLDEGFGLFGATRSRGADPFQYWLTPGTMVYSGYGTAPPAINVAGTFLPNGQPNYIPGLCTPGTTGCGVGLATTANSAPGGPSVQFVPANSGTNQILTSVVNCVYGVQQATPLVTLPVSNCDPSLLTTNIFVGVGSDHPNQPPTYRDRNNFGPAIGFSWRSPLIFGRTVLVRGGFQFTYGSAGRDKTIGSGSVAQLSQVAGGSTYGGALDQTTTTCTSPATCGYDPTAPNYALTQGGAYALTLYDLPYLTPQQNVTTPPSIGGQVNSNVLCIFNCNQGASGDRSVFIQRFGVNRAKSTTAYIPGYQDPRTENFTFSVSTNLTRNSTLAVSYVATLGKNRPTGVNVNMPNVFSNPELLDALVRTRRGEDVPLFDQMFAGLNLTSTSGNSNATAAASGWGPVGTCVTPTGANAAVILAPRQAAYDSGLRDAGNCSRDQIYQSGSAHLRNAGTTNYETLAVDLANGNFAAVAAILANANPPNSVGTTVAAMGQQKFQNAAWQNQLYGGLVRNGCDRMASATASGTGLVANPGRVDLVSGSATSGNTNPVRCFSEDWIIANPALDTGWDTAGGSTGLGTVLKTNWGYTSYQQVQFQYSLRLASGVNLQATYLTSKTLSLPRDFYRTNTVTNNAGGAGSFGTTLGQAISGFSDPRTEESRRKDYGESSDSLRHALRLNGVFQLPFGPGQQVFGKTSGIIGKILGGWQMGIIYNLQSGQPFSILAGDMLNGRSNGVATSDCNAYSGSLGGGTNCQSGLSFPDVVSPLWSGPSGKWVQKDSAVSFFGNPSPFALIPDPQCATSVGRSAMSEPGTLASLLNSCSLQALAMKVAPGTPGAFPLPNDANGQPALIMLQNPMPGTQGTLGAQTMRQPGRFYLDANLAKTVMFTERRGIQFRVDATNVLNHPTPPDLYFSLGPGGTFNDVFTSQNSQTFSTNSALSSGCVQNNAFCGRQVQFGLRMINN